MPSPTCLQVLELPVFTLKKMITFLQTERTYMFVISVDIIVYKLSTAAHVAHCISLSCLRYVEMRTEQGCSEAVEALNGWEDGLGGKIYVDPYRKYPPQYQRVISPQRSHSHTSLRPQRP